MKSSPESPTNFAYGGRPGHYATLLLQKGNMWLSDSRSLAFISRYPLRVLRQPDYKPRLIDCLHLSAMPNTKKPQQLAQRLTGRAREPQGGLRYNRQAIHHCRSVEHCQRDGVCWRIRPGDLGTTAGAGQRLDHGGSQANSPGC